jgi:lipopolysaccharide transport system ATP-binding protein
VQNGKARFVNVQLLDDHGEPVEYATYGQMITLRMAIEVHTDLPLLGFGYHIRDKNGSDIVYSDSEIEQNHIIATIGGTRYIVDWRFAASLMHGNYTIACVLSVPIDLSISKVDFCDFVPVAAQFAMLPRAGSYLYGAVHWVNDVHVTKIG